MLVATKAGLTRRGPNLWMPNGRPEYLHQQAHDSRRRLGVHQIGLWQLHRIDPRIPPDEQFNAARSLIDQGVVRYVGLSEVSVEQIKAASRYFPVATVQNQYNLIDRRHERVLNYCESLGHWLHPVFPAGRRQSCQVQHHSRRHRQRARRHNGPDCAGLVAAAQSGDAADPRNFQSFAPRRECRCSSDPTECGRICCGRPRGP